MNLILNRTEKNAFKHVEFLNPEYNPLTKDGKLAILDIKASVDDKTFVNIELQVSSKIICQNVQCFTYLECFQNKW